MRSSSSVWLSRSMVVVFSLILLTGARCSRQPETSAVRGTKNGTVPISEPDDLVRLINQQRSARGYPTLSGDAGLKSVAQQYSRELAAANTGSINFAINGSDVPTRLRNAGVDFGASGHQGAVNFTDADDLYRALLSVDSFVFSNSNYRRIGVAAVASANNNYWTIIVTD